MLAGSGTEWIVEAVGCRPAVLGELLPLQALLDRAVAELDLRVVGVAQWHKFADPGHGAGGGVTGLYLLTESHLCCHTYPELGLATFNLYCCRPRAEWPWRARLGEALGATQVTVRVLPRGPGPGAAGGAP